MHIPDGFLSTPVWTSSAVISTAYITFVIKRLKKVLQEKLIPMMGVLGAFIFAAQMFNFPVAGGTSGHLLGGVLAAVVIGPLAGSFVLTTVLVIQCLIFQDGGFTALGANVFNLAIVGTLGGYAVYALLLKLLGGKSAGKTALYICYGIAAWFSVVMASASCSVMLALSKTAPIKIVLPAMVGIHMIIGLGEAVITIFALAAIRHARPDLLERRQAL